MEVNVLNIKGEDTGRKVTLDEQIFGIEPNDHVIYLDVKRYLAHQRQGTHKTKGRGEVAYSTRKLFRQKGTGGARRGSIKSPILRGGGTIFGPQPRTYEQKVNKKVKRLARRSALSYKAKANAILILEDFQFEQPKTKDFVALIKALKLNNSKALFLFDQEGEKKEKEEKKKREREKIRRKKERKKRKGEGKKKKEKREEKKGRERRGEKKKEKKEEKKKKKSEKNRERRRRKRGEK